MVRKTRQKRKAKLKDTPMSSEINRKNDNDESMDDSVQSSDNEKLIVKVECEEYIAETSEFSNEKTKFSCTVSIKNECLV